MFLGILANVLSAGCANTDNESAKHTKNEITFFIENLILIEFFEYKLLGF